MRANLIRLIITGLLVWVILSRVNGEEFVTLLKAVDPGLIAIGYVLNLVMIALNSMRWGELVKPLGIRVSFARLTGYYFVCMFFNNFMPTSIGGDVMRVFDLSKHTGKKSSAMASIMVERLLGLYALFPISILAFLLLGSSLPDRQLFLMAEGGMLVLFVIGTVLIRRRTLRLLVPLLGPVRAWLEKSGLPDRMRRLYDFLDYYKEERGAVFRAAVLSVLSRLGWIYACHIFALAIGIELNPLVFFLMMPIVEVGRMLPISLAGIGIREGLLVFILARFGVEATPAIVLSLIIYGVFLVNGLIGGIVYGVRGFLSPARGHEVP